MCLRRPGSASFADRNVVDYSRQDVCNRRVLSEAGNKSEMKANPLRVRSKAWVVLLRQKNPDVFCSAVDLAHRIFCIM